MFPDVLFELAYDLNKPSSFRKLESIRLKVEYHLLKSPFIRAYGEIKLGVVTHLVYLSILLVRKPDQMKLQPDT